MAADQIALQVAGLFRLDAHVGELPEPGVHAVDHVAARRRSLNRAARRSQRRQPLRRDRDWRAVAGNRNDIRDGEGVAVQRDSGGHAERKLLL